MAKYPQLLMTQIKGLLTAGLIIGVGVIPQVWDYSIDYTKSSGRVVEVEPTLLYSSIWQGQMPISLMSHRGHVGGFLATVTVIALSLALCHTSLNRLSWLTFVIASVAIWFTSTRGSWIAYLGGVSIVIVWHFFAHRRTKPVIIASMATILCAAPFLIVRHFDIVPLRNLPQNNMGIDRVSSGRMTIWNGAIWGIQARPLFGWGFDGYALAKVIELGEAQYGTRVSIRSMQGAIAIVNYGNSEGIVIADTSKAHNIFLDLLVSHGVMGTSIFLGIVVFSSRLLLKSKHRAFFPALFAYWVFLFTWFDMAQYAHLQWWILSLGVAEAISFSRAEDQGDSSKSTKTISATHV